MNKLARLFLLVLIPGILTHVNKLLRTSFIIGGLSWLSLGILCLLTGGVHAQTGESMTPSDMHGHRRHRYVLPVHGTDPEHAMAAPARSSARVHANHEDVCSDLGTRRVRVPTVVGKTEASLVRDGRYSAQAAPARSSARVHANHEDVYNWSTRRAQVPTVVGNTEVILQGFSEHGGVRIGIVDNVVQMLKVSCS